MKTFHILWMIPIVLIAGCETSATEYGLSKIPIETSLTHEGMVYTLTVSQKTFNRTDTLTGCYTVTNRSGSTKIFSFANMQQNGYRIVDSTGAVVLFFPTIVSPALSKLELQHGASKEYPIITTFKNHSGNYIPPNKYSFGASLLENKSPTIELSIIVLQ